MILKKRNQFIFLQIGLKNSTFYFYFATQFLADYMLMLHHFITSVCLQVDQSHLKKLTNLSSVSHLSPVRMKFKKMIHHIMHATCRYYYYRYLWNKTLISLRDVTGPRLLKSKISLKIQQRKTSSIFNIILLTHTKV